MCNNIFSEKEIKGVPKNHIPLGFEVYHPMLHTNKFESYKKPFFMKFNCVKDEGRNLFIYGTAGSGKTYTTRGILDRLKLLGFNIIVLTDVKNEYYSSYKKNNSGTIFSDYGEEYKEQDLQVYRPMFFGSPFSKHEKVIQFSFNELERYDIYQLMSIDPTDSKDENKVTMFEIVLRHINENKTTITIDSLINYINSIPEFTTPIKKYFINRLNNCKSLNVIGTMFNQSTSILSDLKENRTIVLNLNNYQNYINYCQIYVSIINRLIAKFQENIDKPIVIVVDEAPAFVPRDGVSSSREEVKLNYQRRRYLGIKNITIAQEVNDVDETCYKSSQCLLLPANPDMEEFTEFIRKTDLYSSNVGNAQYTMNWWRQVFQKMKKHEWIFYDKTATNKLTVIKGVSPLSLHNIKDNQKKVDEYEI